MEQRKKLAFEIVKKSRIFILKKFEKIRNFKEKTANDYVTNIDFELEKKIINTIGHIFSEDAVQSEEKGVIKGKTEYTWLIDPLDGTNNYVRGIPHAGMQIAILKNGKPSFGILLEAFMNMVCYAEKGKGAYMTDTLLSYKKRLRVSGRGVDEGLVIVSSKLKKNPSGEPNKFLEKLVPIVGTIRIYGVAVEEFPLIAKGSAEAIVSYIPKSHDITAGSLLIEEAGGKVTTFDGAPWFPDMPNIIASNGVIHDDIIRILKTL